MKQTTRLCVRASLVGFAIMNVSYAQIDVQSDGAFTIYNNTEKLGIITTGTGVKDVWDRFNQPAVIEPYKAGFLYAGTASKPLGGIYAQKMTSYSQSMASDLRVKKDILDLPSSLDAIRALRPVSFNSH